jgi:hypothetical protein
MVATQNNHTLHLKERYFAARPANQQGLTEFPIEHSRHDHIPYIGYHRVSDYKSRSEAPHIFRMAFS